MVVLSKLVIAQAAAYLADCCILVVLLCLLLLLLLSLNPDQDDLTLLQSPCMVMMELEQHRVPQHADLSGIASVTGMLVYVQPAG